MTFQIGNHYYYKSVLPVKVYSCYFIKKVQIPCCAIFHLQFWQSAQIKDNLQGERILKKEQSWQLFPHWSTFLFPSTPLHWSSGKNMVSPPTYPFLFKTTYLIRTLQVNSRWQAPFIQNLLSMETTLIRCKNNKNILQILISFISWSSKSLNWNIFCTMEKSKGKAELNAETI